MIRFFALLLVAGCVCMSSLCPVAFAANQGTVVETSQDGHIRVEQQRIRGQSHETIVFNTGLRVCRVPDERVSDVDEHGHGFFYNEDDRSGTRYNHEFFMSPNKDWLFVTRKLFHRVNVGYLYRLSGVRPVRIRPHGVRFDEAAIRFFARRLHFPYPTIASAARVIRFDKFTSDHLVFDFSAGQRYDGRGDCNSVVGYYGLKSGRFGLISRSVEHIP